MLLTGVGKILLRRHNKRRLQLMNTKIDTFFSAFLAEQRRKANDG